MAKYSFVFKKQIVLEYLSGGGGSDFLAKKYGVPQGRLVRSWIKNYNELGEDGLRRSREKKNYSFEFKLSVVELYLTTEVSYQELALSVGINNPAILSHWVNDYRTIGPDALRPKRKGRKPKVKKPEKITPITEKEKATSEYLKQLEEENLKLRIENAYLKELRRLRLAEQKPPKEKQE